MLIDDSDEMYRRLVQSVADYAIYMLDTQGHVVNWNAGAQRAKGYTRNEIVGKHFSCFYSADDQASNLPANGLEIARSKGRFQSEGWRYRKDGTAFWANVLIDSVFDDDGRLLGFAKITRDITERQQQLQQLVEAKELAERYSREMTSLSAFLDTVIGHIPSSVIVKDAVSGDVLLVNRQAELLFGVQGDDLLHRTTQESLPKTVSDCFDRLTNESLRAQGLHKAEVQLETAQGQRTLRTSTLIVRGDDLRSSYVMLIADDVTDEHAANAQIHHMAHHDNLTSLPNRLLFRQRLKEALANDGPRNLMTATLCLDLDKFKNVNDTLGHQYGDELLRQLAVRLRSVLRDQDTLARLGGDEFAIVLPGIQDAAVADNVAQRLINGVRPSFTLDGHTVSVGLSVGIAVSPEDEADADCLVRYADMALYEAKRNGRNRAERFRFEMDEAARKRREIEMDLREAISSRQLQLHYQPITDSQQGKVVGFEALMRWRHPDKGMIMPLDFIPIAEETGLIHEIGALALNDACHEAMRWKHGQTVAVNLSPVQFKNSAFVSLVESALRDSRLPAERLELEITESVLLDESHQNLTTLKRLKALGVRIALDDFGTGYSSLSYLRAFPFDKIKIDKSFIRDMRDSRESLAIIRAITGISRSLEIQITAEGVETEEQLAQLKLEDCTHFQGYLFGRPTAADSLET